MILTQAHGIIMGPVSKLLGYIFNAIYLFFNNVGGIDSAGMRLKATDGWTPLNPGQLSNGTDDCGFALLPIPASSTATNGQSANKHDGYVALLWTSSRAPTNDYTMDGVFFETQTLAARMMTYYDTWDYLSIRCVRD